MKPLSFALVLMMAASAQADVVTRTANNGNLVMEDVPEIPQQIVNDLNRYQNVRSAGFRGFSADDDSVFISTRFGDVSQIHRVDRPMGARHQLTFDVEPIGGLTRRPGRSDMLFTRDAGGSEFAQIFAFDPNTGAQTMLTDGESRNGSLSWDREGRRVAYTSTARNGASNDVWMMDPAEPGEAKVILESPDGTSWSASEFSAGGTQVLITNYVSSLDARVNLLDLDTGDVTLLAGGADGEQTFNVPFAFDDEGDGFWLITNQGGEFRQLAWQSFDDGAEPVIVTADIPWDVNGGAISDDRTRAAFTINENGRSAVYLLNPKTREYAKVDSIPVGLAGGLEFSPDGTRLGMTINTSQSPSDTFVLELKSDPLAYGALTRWTSSEVGGLDTSSFASAELIEYPTFDTVDGEPRMIPAWLYKPQGATGPLPVVVSIHGGPEGQARPGFSSTYQMWMDTLGVAVLVPNVRGSAGYGKTYLGLDNGFKREDSVKDIGALLDWIETRDDLDTDRVAVFGGSYGGYMVLASSVYYSDRLRAAVNIVGISNFVTFLENTQDYRRDLRRVEYGDERDPAMRAHLEKISPLNNVSEIAVPMFVVQGENDPRVPVTEAIQIVAALRESGNPVWYMNALNEGHGYRKKENRDIYQQATVLFFQENLIN
ncbi:MAG: alpha/beta fold hydrolase [Pseudomonadota bacterium]